MVQVIMNTPAGPDYGPPSAVHIWRHVTGGADAGLRPADYLRWLAALFEAYRSATREGLALEAQLAGVPDLPARDILPAMREPFLYWLVQRFDLEDGHDPPAEH